MIKTGPRFKRDKLWYGPHMLQVARRLYGALTGAGHAIRDADHDRVWSEERRARRGGYIVHEAMRPYEGPHTRDLPEG